MCVSELPLLRWGRYPQWCVGRRRQSHPGPHRGRCRRCSPDRGRASSHQAVWRGQMGCRWQRCPDPAARSSTLGQSNAFWDKMVWDYHWDSKYLGRVPLWGCNTAQRCIRPCWSGCWVQKWLGAGWMRPCLWWSARWRLRVQQPHLRQRAIDIQWMTARSLYFDDHILIAKIHTFSPLYCATQRWKFKF